MGEQKFKQFVQSNMKTVLKLKMFLSFFLVEDAEKQNNLTSKLNELRELVRQKNNVDSELSQELQEAKDELEHERTSYRAELNERETRERALEVSKQQLETQLTEVEKENCELLRELSLLQVRTFLLFIEG